MKKKQESPASELKKAPVAKQLKKQAKTQTKRDRVIRTRMWFSTLIASVFNDRGTIPPNIGNKIMVTNNLYVTKNSLSVVFAIREFRKLNLKCITSRLIFRLRVCRTISIQVQAVCVREYIHGKLL